MYKVLITTSAFTTNACATSSTVVEFETSEEAITAVDQARKNTSELKKIFVSAVFLNPNRKK